MLRDGTVANVEIIRKFVRANPDGTGRVLTDIDFIGTVNGQRAYVQTKISPAAFGSVEKVKEWVAKALKDSQLDGISEPVIRYVVPDPDDVPNDIATFLKGLDVNVFIAAPFQ